MGKVGLQSLKRYSGLQWIAPTKKLDPLPFSFILAMDKIVLKLN